MDFMQIAILALIQGLTEFLPISSSGHLILAPHLFGFADQGLELDVAVHFGTLIAVVGYFRHDIIDITLGWFRALPPKAPANPQSRLGWAIIVGVLPVMVVGLLVKDYVEHSLREPWIIGTTTILFGLLLGWADWRSRRQRDIGRLTLGDATYIGLAQVLALIPGTSRSGITMTAGLMLGLTREASARFSFLLSIPTVLGSAILILDDLVAARAQVDWTAIGTSVVLSSITAWLCIHYFLAYIERMGMQAFVVYRLLLGGLIFYLIW
jgi:undecaprenyl-diphosphatase